MLRHRRFELNPTNTIAWILGLILLAQSSTFVFGNYYATLGLEKSCSDKEVNAYPSLKEQSCIEHLGKTLFANMELHHLPACLPTCIDQGRLSKISAAVASGQKL